MSKLVLPSFSPEVSQWFITAFLRIRDAIEGIVPSDNFRQIVLTGTTPGAANTEFTLEHGLKRNMAGPDGNGLEFIYWLDGAGTLYESDRANWTSNTFKLKCTDASRAYTIIVR